MSQRRYERTRLPSRVTVIVLLVLGAVSGCGEQKALSFNADAQPSGPRLWLQHADTHDTRLTFEVWAAEVGAVLGYSFHVRLDDGVVTAAGEVTPAAALGSSSEAALYLQSARADDLAVGGVRRDLGETALDGPVLLATFPLDVTGEVPTPLRVERVVFRRAGGAFVATSAAGGTIVRKGGES